MEGERGESSYYNQASKHILFFLSCCKSARMNGQSAVSAFGTSFKCYYHISVKNIRKCSLLLAQKGPSSPPPPLIHRRSTAAEEINSSSGTRVRLPSTRGVEAHYWLTFCSKVLPCNGSTKIYIHIFCFPLIIMKQISHFVQVMV